MYIRWNTSDARDALIDKYVREDFVIDKSGCKMVEVIGQSFVADETTIFGTLNFDYAHRELEWYLGMSLNINDIPGEIPKIWKRVATPEGWINSNYGWCVFSAENFHQYNHAVNELRSNPYSRRASVIYTRPSMHEDYNRDGMSDFICTHAVDYHIRNGALYATVHMRSNDAVFGYKNDRFWQKFILEAMAANLNVKAGDIYWCASSLHVYERHFHLIEPLAKTWRLDDKEEVGDEVFPPSCGSGNLV